MFFITCIAALCPIIWGATFFVTTEFLPENASFWIAFWRAFPIAVLWIAVLRHWPRPEWWGKLIVISACNVGLFFPCLFLTANLLPQAAGLGTMLIAAQPVPLALLIWWWQGRKPRWQTWVAIGIALIGIFILLDDPNKIINPYGVAVALFGVLMLAIATVLVERWGIMDDNIGAYTAWQLAIGGLMILPIAYLWEGPCPDFFAAKNGIAYASLYGIVFLSVFASGIAYWIWFWSLARLPLISVSMIALLSPIVAYIIDVFYKDLPFTMSEGIGMCLVIAGLIYQSTLEKNAPPPTDDSDSCDSATSHIE